MKVLNRKYIKPAVAIGIGLLMTSPAFAAGGSGIFSSLDTVFQNVVDTLSGTTGRLVAIIIFMGTIVAAWVGYRSFWTIGVGIVFIAIFFGGPQIVDFIRNAAQ